MRTHLDLFSGIGGFALAARWTRWTTIGFSEIDPYCNAVLKKHWPEVPNYGDIRNIPTDLGPVRLITGGFPCQPFSCAGKRRGKDDVRYLWPAMRDVIAAHRPPWVLGENVPGIIGLVLHDVLADLEGLGYACQPLVIPAVAVDARHRRDRVWIVAYYDRGNRKASRTAEVEGWSTDLLKHGGSQERNVADANQPRPYAAALSGLHRAEESAGTRDAELERRGKVMAHTLRIGGIKATNGCEQGKSMLILGGETRPAQWLPEPDVGRVADGIPNRVDRLRALGNSIVPQVAAEIMRYMGEIEDANNLQATCEKIQKKEEP